MQKLLNSQSVTNLVAFYRRKIHFAIYTRNAHSARTPLKVVEENGKLYANGWSFRLAIPKKLADRYSARVNSEVIIGIRPEHINDRSFVSDMSGKDVLEAMADVIEPIGSEAILIVTTGE